MKIIARKYKALRMSVCSSSLSFFMLLSIAEAAPNGGNIVGGTGSINTNGLTTTINQNTQSMAIDWNSYNLNSNEIVNYLQPSSSSLSLNRILGGSASQIYGQINANGQVILVNPNGLFFGQDASINVGGLIASGLDIDPVDFMNGDYIFNEIIGTEGTVINSGLINASLGGSVALLGKQVKNQGIINAKLGAVGLAAGKEAILTFDNQGLIGVRVTKEVLQDEIGVDPAVLNSGEINASGGRVLLTGSVSRDVFSDAVNHSGIQQATSVVVHEDGSFTLGGGADVVNSGTLDVSSNDDAGDVVILGDNISHTGTIKADSEAGAAGMIELQTIDTLRLEEASLTSATSLNKKGGQIKLLGHKVGLFDQVEVDASGQLGGGQVLIGGDFQGKNDRVTNARVTYVGEETNIRANANHHGDGGNIIVWADHTTRYYGNIEATGGSTEGNGGFSEVSGKEFLGFEGSVNLSAKLGETGTLLLDPRDITIVDGGTDVVADNDIFSENPNSNVEFDADLITDILIGNGTSAADVELQAREDIIVDEAITVSIIGNSNNLTLRAGDDITVNSNITLTGGDVTLAKDDACGTTNCAGAGNSQIRLNADINTNGGNISLAADEIEVRGAGAIRQISTGSNGGNIDLTGNIISSDTTNQNSLTLVAGTGNVTLNNDIGTNANDDYLDVFTIDSANVVNLQQVKAGNGGASNEGIKISASTVNLAGDLDTNLTGAFGGVDIIGNVVLTGGITIQTGGGDVDVDGNVNAQTIGGEFINIISNSGALTITGAVGNNVQLGGFQINSAGDINLGTSSGGINANEINIAQSNSFSSNSNFTISTVSANSEGGIVTINADTSITTGNITTNGGTATAAGLNAGNITLNAQNITIGALTAIGSDAAGIGPFTGGAGGVVNITATNSSPGTKSVTLNGNINTNGGAGIGGGGTGNPGSVTINLNGTATGNVTINHTGAFATGLDVSITSTGGISDTLDAGDFNNTWIVNDLDSTLNGNIIFNGFETLVGGSLNDNFTLNASALAGGTIDGSSNSGNSVTRSVGTNTWVLTDTHTGTLDGSFDFANIQTINGGTETDTLTARNQANNWVMISETAGSVAENTATPGDTVAFTNMDNLNGGSGIDIFDLTGVANTVTVELQSGTVPTGNIHITNAEQIDANASFVNTLISDDTTNNWDIDAPNAGTLNAALGFSGFSNLTGGSQDDNFVFSDTGQLDGGTIDGGGGTNSVTGRNTTNNWTLNANDGGVLAFNATTTTLTLIQTFIGGTGSDTLTVTVPGAHDWDITGDGSGAVNDLTNGFSNMENLVGNADVDTFTLSGGTISGNIDGTTGSDILNADAVNNTWLITGIDDGSVTGVGSFTDIENLNGNSQTDSFTLQGGTVSGTMDGGGSGANSLQADNLPNSWTIDGNNSGDVTGVAGFSNIQNLTGGTLADDFNITDSNAVDGLINGGNGTDSVNIAALATNTIVEVGNNVTGNLNILDIESLTANNTLNNTLIADDQLNNWMVTGGNSGSLNGMSFIGFKRLQGNLQNDTFEFFDGWAVDNGIDAGVGGNDLADGSAVTGVLVFQIGAGSLENFEAFTGNNIDSTLIGDNVANNWNITGSNSGTIGTQSFRQFTNLIGNNQVDTFNVSANGALGGTASGGAGDDIANIALSGSESGNFTFDGEGDNDTVNLNGGHASYQGEYQSDAGGFEQLSYSQAGNSFTVRYVRTETVNDNLSSANLNILGTTSDDNITLGNNSFIVNAATAVNHIGNTSLSLDGLSGNDSISNLAASTVRSATFSISNFDTIGSAGNALNTDITRLELSNISGDIFIDEVDQINLGAFNNVTGDLTLSNQTGDILDNAALQSDANLQITALNGDILLDNANQLGGELSLQAANGDVSLVNEVATQLGNLTAQNLVINATADITDTASAQIQVTGNSSLQATNADILLDAVNHQFSNLTVTDTNNLSLTDGNSNGLTVDSIDVNGDSNLIAVGNLSTRLITAGGDVSLITAAAIIDSNGDSDNIIANTLAIDSAAGIGNNNALNTRVQSMDIVNRNSGEVNLQQFGEIELVRLQNTGSNGDINFRSDRDILFNPGSTHAILGSGDLVMNTDAGNFFGLGTANINNPDITAQNATFIGLSGTFGTFDRNLTLNVPGSVLINTRGSFNPQFVPPGPTSIDARGIDFTILSTISAVAGEQLVEIESLSEVDPAIFTALRNFSLEEISIRMPRDQLYDEELEENANTQ